MKTTEENLLDRLRFQGRHRCPRCRMPLQAEELACPVCALDIVFIGESGEVMVEMVSLADPHDLESVAVGEYHLMLALEAAGDMHLLRVPLPTAPQRADLMPFPDGTLRIRFHNRIALEDIRRG